MKVTGTDSLLVMAKVGPAGAPLWLKSYPATTTINLSNAIGALAPTPSNGVVFAGAIPGHLELSATAVVNDVNAFNHHSFIAGFDP